MAAFVGVVIIFIINNYRYLLPIQYIECDMIYDDIASNDKLKFYSIWTYQSLL